MGPRVEADGARVLVGHRPADVVVAAQVGHPCRRGWSGPQARQRLAGECDVAGGQRRPEHHHQLVVVREVALGTEPVVRPEVRHELLRSDDRLRLEPHTRCGHGHARPQCLQDQKDLGLVLAVGPLALPEEGRRVEPQDFDAAVGEDEDDSQHRLEDVGVGPVEVPLVVVESRPDPAHAVHVGEGPGCLVGEHLGQRPLEPVGQLAVGEHPVERAVRRVARRCGERPRVPSRSRQPRSRRRCHRRGVAAPASGAGR